jgi:membrane protein implicated in regulation of membrane protease activity
MSTETFCQICRHPTPDHEPDCPVLTGESQRGIGQEPPKPQQALPVIIGLVLALCVLSAVLQLILFFGQVLASWTLYLLIYYWPVVLLLLAALSGLGLWLYRRAKEPYYMAEIRADLKRNKKAGEQLIKDLGKEIRTPPMGTTPTGNGCRHFPRLDSKAPVRAVSARLQLHCPHEGAGWLDIDLKCILLLVVV